jgi:hypothetical protein
MTGGAQGQNQNNIGNMTGSQAAGQLGQSIPRGTATTIAGALNGNGGNIPPWLKGLQVGQQIAQMGQRPQAPQGQGFQPHPMANIGGSPGMQGGAVPGAQGMGPQGMTPPMPSQAPGMTNTGQQPAGQVSPQMLQMLMQMRQQGGGGLMGR